MKKGNIVIHIGNIGRLNKLDVEMDGHFLGCEKADECCVDKESIEGGMWMEFDDGNDEGEDKETLNRDSSYMVCTKYAGLIYFYNDGQAIKDFLDGQNDVFSEWAKENRIEKIEFLQTLLELAMVEQLRTGVPWQVTLGQIANESGWGSSEPYDEYTNEQSFNLFGIKYFGKIEDEDEYVRSWTKEDINRSELDKWEQEQKKWALEGEELIIDKDLGNNKIKIKVIQPFLRYESYAEGMMNHSDVLLHERYSDAWEYEDNPFIYLSIIASTYGSDGDYERIVKTIMDDYFVWDDKEKDLEEYNTWKSQKRTSD